MDRTKKKEMRRLTKEKSKLNHKKRGQKSQIFHHQNPKNNPWEEKIPFPEIKKNKKNNEKKKSIPKQHYGGHVKVRSGGQVKERAKLPRIRSDLVICPPL